MAVQESAAQLSMTLKVQEYPTLKVGSAVRASDRAWLVPADRGGVGGEGGGAGWGPGRGLGHRAGSGGGFLRGRASGIRGALCSGLPGALGSGSREAREAREVRASQGPGVYSAGFSEIWGCVGPASPGPGGLRGRSPGLPGGGGVWGPGFPGFGVLQAGRVVVWGRPLPALPSTSWQGVERVCLAPRFALPSPIVAPSSKRKEKKKKREKTNVNCPSDILR